MRGEEKDVYAQEIASDGSYVWHTSGLPIGYYWNDQWEPAITTDGFGGAAFAWRDLRHGTETDNAIYAQKVNENDFTAYSISGYVKITNDGPGIEGVDLDLYDLRSGSPVPLASTTTNSSGYYVFTGLTPFESFRLELDTQQFDNLTNGMLATPSEPVRVVPDMVQNHHLDFDTYVQAVPTLVAYVDRNDNGEIDTGEEIAPPLTGDELAAVGCPQGDHEVITISIDFDPNDMFMDIPANAITTYGISTYCEGPTTASTAAATPDYDAEITLDRYSGCDANTTGTPVYVWGTLVGNVPYWAKNVDVSGGSAPCFCDGVVDLYDLSYFSSAYGKVYPDPLYDACVDYKLATGVIDINDFSTFSQHYLHQLGDACGGQGSPPRWASSDASVRLVGTPVADRTNGTIGLEVGLQRAEDAVAAVMIFDIQSANCDFIEWIASGEFDGQVVATTVDRDNRQQLFVFAAKNPGAAGDMSQLGKMIIKNIDEEKEFNLENLRMTRGDLLDGDGNQLTFEGIEVQESQTPVIRNYLAQNHPNPFNPTTTIGYSVKENVKVSLRIYNVKGQLVRTLVDEVATPGITYHAIWNGMDNAGEKVSTGVYFYRIAAGDFVETKKMVLLK
jgi:hypothetical protein